MLFTLIFFQNHTKISYLDPATQMQLCKESENTLQERKLQLAKALDLLTGT